MIFFNVFVLAQAAFSLGKPILHSSTRSTERDVDGWQALYDGNKNFRAEINPQLLKNLTKDGQRECPEFIQPLNIILTDWKQDQNLCSLGVLIAGTLCSAVIPERY